MSKVILLGVGPLPSPTLEKVYAPGLRLEAFLEALRQGGHSVLLAEFSFGGSDVPHIPRHGQGIYAHRRLSPNMEEAAKQVDLLVGEYDADCMIALTDVGAVAAIRSGYKGPLHVDYFGHPMAERQQQASVHGSNASLAEQWISVLEALLRADRFSVCSLSQRLALIGELGAAGRLNSETCSQEMIDVIPPTVPFFQPLKARQANYLENQGVPQGAKVIFSSGGYNTWVDEEMLFLGVEEALRNDPNLHFVSTGGAIDGHVKVVFERFQQRVHKSPVRERFHLLGWVTHDEMIDAMLGAHVAVNCDFASLEGELGCRNRLLGWLWAGLRVVTTVTSDSTRRLADQKILRTVGFRDWQQLAQALKEEAQKDRVTDLPRLHDFLKRKWSGKEQFNKLRAWAANPTRAADRLDAAIVSNPLADLQNRFLESAERNRHEQSIRKFARETAQTLLGSRAIRLFGKMNPDALKRLKELSKL